MPRNTAVDGLTYLLATDAMGDSVVPYTSNEMADVFTQPERATLAAGKPVTKAHRLGRITYHDMVAATRDAAEAEAKGAAAAAAYREGR
jgi:hypothetical protein